MLSLKVEQTWPALARNKELQHYFSNLGKTQRVVIIHHGNCRHSHLVTNCIIVKISPSSVARLFGIGGRGQDPQMYRQKKKYM